MILPHFCVIFFRQNTFICIEGHPLYPFLFSLFFFRPWNPFWMSELKRKHTSINLPAWSVTVVIRGQRWYQRVYLLDTCASSPLHVEDLRRGYKFHQIPLFFSQRWDNMFTSYRGTFLLALRIKIFLSISTFGDFLWVFS